MRCEDCKWWDNSTQSGAAQPDTTGVCRVSPPRPDERDRRAVWPFTEDTDWCRSFVEQDDAGTVYSASARIHRLERDNTERSSKIMEWERFIAALYTKVPPDQRVDWPKRPDPTDDIPF